MKKSQIRIIVIILLMAFIFVMEFIPALRNIVISDNSAYLAFMQMVFLVIFGVCFFPLYLSKLFSNIQYQNIA